MEENLELCEQKKERATKMIGGLGGEKDRWSAAADGLKLAYDNIVGDVLLSSGVVAYLGAFTVDFRQVSYSVSIFCHLERINVTTFSKSLKEKENSVN